MSTMLKYIRRLIGLLVLLVLCFVVQIFSPSHGVAIPNVNIQRVIGSNGYEMAAATSQKGWATASSVILVNANDLADILSSALLAYAKNAPILLAGKNDLPIATLKELQRLKPKDLYIIGNTAMISKNLEEKLKSQYKVTRIFGRDRYETAFKIGQNAISGKKIEKAFILAYDDIIDGLAISPASARYNIPVLFVDKRWLNSYTKQALREWGVKDAVLVGGTAIIPVSIENDVKNMGIKTTRIAGADKYSTALQAARYFNRGDYEGAAIVSANIYENTLTASVLAAKLNIPILLVDKSAVKGEVLDYVAEIVWGKNLYVLGGNEVIDDDVLVAIKGVPAHILSWAVSSSQIDLSWYKAARAVKYNIYRAESKNGFYKKIAVTTMLAYSDKGLKPLTTYWYRIGAVDQTGNESISSTIYVITKDDPDIPTTYSFPKALTVLNTGECNAAMVKQKPWPNSENIGKVYGSLMGVKLVRHYNAYYSEIETWDYESLSPIRGFVPRKYIKTAYPTGSYSILMDISAQKVGIYKNGKLFKKFICSTGMDYNKYCTPTGTYLIGSRGKSFYNVRLKEGGYNWVRFNKGYLFHSVPFGPNGKIISSELAKLGQKASHGCIRLSLTDAKWFYDNIQRGAIVVVKQ